MENSFKALDELLVNKTRLYSKFIDLLKEEWTAVTQNNLERLEEILENKEALVEEIQEINVMREKVVHTIAINQKIPVQEITLKKIIELKENLWSERMEHHRKKLREQIEIINELNLTNRNLINRSAMTAKKSVTWLYQVDASYSPYHANGQIADAKFESRMVSTDA